MQFRTEIEIPAAAKPLDRAQGIVTLGSCFAEVIGRKLEQTKAKALVNPFGTVFNPLSVHKLVAAALTQDFEFLEQGMVQQQGRWVHYDFHSSFAQEQPEVLLQNLREKLIQVGEFLKTAQALLLTWGTAFVYERLDTGAVVANCHKVPQKQFNKRLLPLEEIQESTKRTLNLLQTHCPHLQVILTVSPVRHLKDTLPLNSVSKSLLRVAAHLAQEQHAQVSYFPAYELLLDDLRDYRFFSDDLLHPSSLAEEYIWNKFLRAYADPTFIHFLDRWQQLSRDLAHKPFNPESPAHQAFLQKLLQRLQALASEVDVTEEIAAVQTQILQ
ncbi:GSCFA domain-containing protein [Rufibacter sp. LB8]|uniref:GSCFA domain-containing protein n=1 Tax=Rufibacter sp. LB8 TaxID=2777781 RepID=UPI00178C6917|nr:GSCFA domain-containing protein [Rufibacter sp. LB8]